MQILQEQISVHAVLLTPLAYFHVGNDCLLHLPALTYHNRQVFKLLTIV
ncbi:hypothetical protein B0F87_101490 [Methylobacter tundripaludum]|uniref:Uncharacterized protein n=1 Tax=Methylobacter tundripaludum TaxID=173365 RepID=A0A2S6HKV4_9GAMM|nr:hypothetical protein B0F87_101490 [Methylobacter tundripaludum]